jgi:uncharacterized protein YaiE (UPF0345 family)
MVNYLEGQASMGGQALNQNSVGSAIVPLGQTLATQAGKAEMLLTPGALLRVNDNSAVRMDSSNVGNIEVTVQAGRAMVEADQVLKDERLMVHMGPATTRVMTDGLYDFDAATGQMRVFKGRAEVTENNKTYTVQGGHDFEVNAATLKARGFDKSKYEDNFYRWSSLRSSYLAEANADAARGFANGAYGYPPNYAYANDPSWFWDPYFSAYTWLPWDGYFFSPFGYGFYSPGFAFVAPFYGYGFGGGYHHFGPGYAPPVARGGLVGGYHGGVITQRGFQGGGVAGGGFHGGGAVSGGFHGGGFAGGGFHGGGGGGRR